MPEALSPDPPPPPGVPRLEFPDVEVPSVEPVVPAALDVNADAGTVEPPD